MKNVFRFAALLLAFGALASCSSDTASLPEVDEIPAPPQEEQKLVKTEAVPISLSHDGKSMARSLEPTYLKLATEISREALKLGNNTTAYVVTSPLSTGMLLGMIANGIDKESREELTTYLGIDNLDVFNEMSCSLIEGLPKADPLAATKVRNSVWVNGGLPVTLTADYNSVVTDFFGSEVFTRDFVNDYNNTLESMNMWCADASDNRIDGLKMELIKEAFVLWLNTVSFKAPWGDEYFSKENTTKEVFHGSSYMTPVDMMHSSRSVFLPYYEDENIQFVSLDFGNSAYSISFILPDESSSLDEMLGSLTYDKLRYYWQHVSGCGVKLSIPKFNVDSKLDLADILHSCGLEMLRKQIGLTMFAEDNVDGILKLEQYSMFSLDESGAEAAAQSDGLGLISSPGPSQKIYEVSLDRPFFFFIKEKSTGAWLLAGSMANLI